MRRQPQSQSIINKAVYIVDQVPIAIDRHLIRLESGIKDQLCIERFSPLREDNRPIEHEFVIEVLHRLIVEVVLSPNISIDVFLNFFLFVATFLRV